MSCLQQVVAMARQRVRYSERTKCVGMEQAIVCGWSRSEVEGRSLLGGLGWASEAGDGPKGSGLTWVRAAGGGLLGWLGHERPKRGGGSI